MFFGIGSVAGWMCGLPLVIGLVVIFFSNPEAFLKPYVERKCRKIVEKEQKEKKELFEDWSFFKYFVVLGGIGFFILFIAYNITMN